MPKYLSGRVKRTPQNKLTDDRYQYLDIGQAEPNIGDPPTASGTPGIPVGQQYQLVSVLSNPGERYWIPIGGGLIPGAISIYEEGSLVSGVSSITQLNFVGNSLTADAAPYVAGVSAGNIATITAAPPGPNSSVLFKESNDFATSTDLVFNSGILTIGKGVKIGIGGTIITANASTGYPLVGINEANPTQELDVNGDIRIRGTIYDFNNEPGDQGELLLKGLNGLEWTNQNAITAGAGGDIGQVQYHNTAGLVDGADIFYYDAVNDRVGIGSTQPAQVLDVLGVSTFIGGVTVDHLYVTGITTALNLINADGGIKANTAQVTDLTEDRVVYVGPNGELVDSSNLTFDDYTFGASGINVSGCTTTSQLEATGVSTLGNIQLDTNTIDTKSGNLILNSAGGTVQVNAKIFLNNVTQSTTKSTGALTISGGLGIIKDVNVGGAVSFKGNSDPTGVAVTLAAAGGITTTGGNLSVEGLGRVFSNQTSTSSGTGALVVTGGVGILEKLNVKDITRIESSQQSSNTASGALQVEGGAGIKGNVYVGDNVDIEDNLKVNKTSEFVGFATFRDDIGVAGVSTFVGFATFIDDVGIGKTLWLNSYVRDINSDTGFSDEVGVCKTDYRLASVGTGVSWRPSGVQTKRTIWVTKNGCDTNSGLLEGDAKATIGGAAAIAEETDTIKIRPGVYFENNPVGLRTDVSITGEDLRLVTVIPENPSKDVFHVRNGCLVENLNFAGSSINQSHSGAGAVAFPPSEQAVNEGKDFQAESGYTEFGPFRVLGLKRYKSPYVRNCTNFMTESIGMKIDGAYATADSFGQDLKSMVCDSFTQYNENGIGVSLTNNAYAQLVSIFTINADIGIYADTGGQCDLTNSNSSFGNFGLVAVGLGSTQFTGKVSNINPAGAIIGSTNAENQDTVVCKEVFEKDSNTPRRPFDGQALFFKIDLDNYPDVQGTGILDEPLQQLESIKLRSGVDLSGFSAIDPPSVIIRDADGIQEPKGPQGIIAEATATVNAKGVLTEIDVIAQGRNYLPTQNIEVSIEGNTGLADAVMKPIYYTVDSSTDRTASGPSAGICTITFNEFIPYELFPDDEFSLQRISRILTSSHSFEYIGSGTDINKSTPLQGAIPIKENEIVASDGAQIPFTSTDQKGNFDIGEGIQIDQTTSTIRGRDFSRAIQAEVTPLILALR